MRFYSGMDLDKTMALSLLQFRTLLAEVPRITRLELGEDIDERPQPIATGKAGYQMARTLLRRSRRSS